MTAKDPVHPFVEQTMTISDQIVERMLAAKEKYESERVGMRNEDGDVALQVNSDGVLTMLWLKPGIIDRRKPAEIAAEINKLLTAAGDKAAEAAHAEFNSYIADCTALAEKMPHLDVNNPYIPAGVLPVDGKAPAAG